MTPPTTEHEPADIAEARRCVREHDEARLAEAINRPASPEAAAEMVAFLRASPTTEHEAVRIAAGLLRRNALPYGHDDADFISPDVAIMARYIVADHAARERARTGQDEALSLAVEYLDVCARIQREEQRNADMLTPDDQFAVCAALIASHEREAALRAQIDAIDEDALQRGQGRQALLCKLGGAGQCETAAALRLSLAQHVEYVDANIATANEQLHAATQRETPLRAEVERVREALANVLRSANPNADAMPYMHRAWEAAKAALDGKLCRCGSGAHPRRCEVHPGRYEMHVEEINQARELDDLRLDRTRLARLLWGVKRECDEAMRSVGDLAAHATEQTRHLLDMRRSDLDALAERHSAQLATATAEAAKLREALTEALDEWDAWRATGLVTSPDVCREDKRRITELRKLAKEGA